MQYRKKASGKRNVKKFNKLANKTHRLNIERTTSRKGKTL